MALPSLMNLTEETETFSVGALQTNYIKQWNQAEHETSDIDFTTKPNSYIKFHNFDMEMQTVDVDELHTWLENFSKIIKLSNYLEPSWDEDVLEDVYLNLKPKAEYKVNVKITEIVRGKPSPFLGDDVETDAWVK